MICWGTSSQPPFLQENNRTKGEKGSTQDGGNVVIHKVESKQSLLIPFEYILEGLWVTFGPLWGKRAYMGVFVRGVAEV